LQAGALVGDLRQLAGELVQPGEGLFVAVADAEDVDRGGGGAEAQGGVDVLRDHLVQQRAGALVVAVVGHVPGLQVAQVPLLLRRQLRCLRLHLQQQLGEGAVVGGLDAVGYLQQGGRGVGRAGFRGGRGGRG